jgi:hypothetical protein
MENLFSYGTLEPTGLDRHADAYEDAAYQRVLAPLRSGGSACVYVRA